jgi:hypothetical protein
MNMSWQQSIQVAVKALRQEESTLRKQLDTVVSKIRELEDIGRGAGGAVGTRKRATSRRLSAAGRAAISRAAKKRWAQYRAQGRGKK